MEFKKTRYICWSIAILLSIICLILNSCTQQTPKEQILVYAPNEMFEAFKETVEETKLKRHYEVVYTESIEKANFKVTEGKTANGDLFAYTPIVTVINSDEDFYAELQKNNIIVPSQVASDSFDLDVKKVIENAISGNSGIHLNIAYPPKDSAVWDDFYDLLLCNINDGCYPQSEENLELCKLQVEKFLSSKSVMEISDENIFRNKGISKNVIYFVTEQQLVTLSSKSNGLEMRIVYPQNVVYHNFYVEYDELGKQLFGSINYGNWGYIYMYYNGYCSKIYFDTIKCNEFYDQRTKFNVIEIPRKQGGNENGSKD